MPKGQGKTTVQDVMHKFKYGGLHSGSSTGPLVTRADQAIAIALNEAGLSNSKKASKPRKKKTSYDSGGF